jgi:orotidine-5'-phosphate decarboxylase
MGGWNYNCFPYLYARYSVGGYGVDTPNYWKIQTFGNGSIDNCKEENQFCYVCEPPSEDTTLNDFQIFPEPQHSSVWQEAAQYVTDNANQSIAAPAWNYDMVPGSPYTDQNTSITVTVPGNPLYIKMGRDPYQDLVFLAKDLGADGIVPFLAGGQGAFALVRTSNPSGDALQTLPLADGRTIAEAVADLVSKLGEATVGASGFSSLGAVVGATKRAEIASLRARMPRTIFLVPGYGAQGGTADDVRAAFTRGNQGALITASRSVIYPSAPASDDWRGAIRAAATQFAREIRAITGATA